MDLKKWILSMKIGALVQSENLIKFQFLFFHFLDNILLLHKVYQNSKVIFLILIFFVEKHHQIL